MGCSTTKMPKESGVSAARSSEASDVLTVVWLRRKPRSYGVIIARICKKSRGYEATGYINNIRRTKGYEHP